MSRTLASRILATVVVAVCAGALLGNIIGGAVLGLSDTVRGVLWVLGAIGGGWLTWSRPEDIDAQESPALVPGPVIAVACLAAVSCVVLLEPPLGTILAAIAIGAIPVVAWFRRGRHVS